MSRPQLADVRVRRAIAEAVDWKRINDTVYPRNRSVRRLRHLPAIVGRARRCRRTATIRPTRGACSAQAGWQPGADGVLHKGALALHLTIYATTGHQENEHSEVLIQSMLRAFGIDVVIRNYPGSLCSRRTVRSTPESTISNGRSRPTDPIRTTPATGTARSFRRTARTRRGSTIRSSTPRAAPRRAPSIPRPASGSTSARRSESASSSPPSSSAGRTNYTAMNADVKGYVPAAFVGDTWNAWEWSI